MNKDERSASMVAHHEKEIARMHLKENKTQAEIAEALGISQATVSRDLKRLRAQWGKEAKRGVRAWQGEMIEELKQVKASAWANHHAEKTEAKHLKEIRDTIMAMFKVLGMDSLVVEVDSTDDKGFELIFRQVPSRGTDAS